MSETIPFPSNPAPAAGISWRPWGADALDEADRSGRPVLLSLVARWCHWCRAMDETTFSDAAIIDLIDTSFVAVRADTDRNPHVQDRYLAGGWPTTAFLTPTGEVLWAGTYVDAAQLRQVAEGVIAAWSGRRDELELEIGRRRRALETARAQRPMLGLVRRDAVEDVLSATRAEFDAVNGGFGDAPKFPQPDALELMYARSAAEPEWGAMADRTLAAMLAGELWDAVDGGFFHYASAGDWTAPRQEKLLAANAGLLDAYSLGYTMRGRAEWREVAERTVAWVDRTLGCGSLHGGSQAADPAYFGAADRRDLTPPPVDETLYTDANARWIAALARAGARFGNEAWIDRAQQGMLELLRLMRGADGSIAHYHDAGRAHLSVMLADTLECLRASLALAQVCGNPVWLETARSLARRIEQTFWADDGGFWDRVLLPRDVGALRYQERQFEQNAAAARALLDLSHITGERSWRGMAERTLSCIGPQAGRHATAAALFALATEEFFESPATVVIANPDADAAAAALRRAAFALPLPTLRVWTVPAGYRVGPQRFDAAEGAAAYLWTNRGCSPAVHAPERLAELGARAR